MPQKQKSIISLSAIPNTVFSVVLIVGLGAVAGLWAFEIFKTDKKLLVINESCENDVMQKNDVVDGEYFGNEFIQVKLLQKNATVKSPILISGKANVFEGNVRVRIKDENENILADTFITASGAYDKLYPFEKEISYTAPVSQSGIIEVFEENMKDGSEINKVIIPVVFEDYIDISDWKVYRNEEYGFEVKYPNDWAISDHSSGLLVLKNTQEKINSAQSFFVINIKENYEINPETSDITMEKINLDGRLGYKYFYQEGAGISEIVLIQSGRDTLELSSDYFASNGSNFNDRKIAIQGVINPILSTFKFIEKDETQKIKLYYYNSNYDPKFDCLSDAVLPVEREILITNTPIQDTINLLIKGEITEQEKLAGFFSEFPNPEFKLLGASLEDKTLTLSFTEVPSFTTGGSCRTNLLAAQIIKTAEQFEEVEKVKFGSIELFQP